MRDPSKRPPPSPPPFPRALQLPLDGRLRRSALDRRKTLGARLAHLGIAVLHRKRSAAWSLWVEETRQWMEELHLVSGGWLSDGLLRAARCASSLFFSSSAEA